MGKNEIKGQKVGGYYRESVTIVIIVYYNK